MLNLPASAILLIALFAFLPTPTTSCADPHCANCVNGSAVCLDCGQGYYVDSGVCIICPSNCLNCSYDGTSVTCTTCQSNYGFYNGSSNCTLCTASNAEICSSANNCTSNSDCITCDIYALNGGNICLRCNYIYRDCYRCDNLQCNVCEPGYYLNFTANSRQCVICNIYKCIQCTNGPTCQGCQDGYYAANGTCYPCQLPCSTCNTFATSCQSCQNSSNIYVLIGDICTDCLLIEDNCLNCTAINQATTQCNSCISDSYFLNNVSRCVACLPPCLTCSSQTDCFSCVSDNEYADGGNCTLCKFAMPKCIRCASSTVCLECQSGFFINFNASYCQPCENYYYLCATCNITQCLSCQPFSLLDSSNNCIATGCDSPCASCQQIPTKCLSCITGYYLLNITCYACNSTCVDCSNSTYCSQCHAIYQWVAGQCLQCPPRQYHSPYNMSCQPCADHCLTCVYNQGCLTCDELYQITTSKDTQICYDICGDGYTNDNQCDGGDNNNDGCSSECTIDEGFNCTYHNTTVVLNNVSVMTSVSDCSFIREFRVKPVKAQKSLQTNGMILSFEINPYLYGFPTDSDNSTYIGQIFQLSPLNDTTNYSIRLSPSKQTVQFQIMHSQDISDVPFALQIDIASIQTNTSMFMYLEDNYSYPYTFDSIVSLGGLGQAHEEDSYNWTALLQTLSTALSFVSLGMALIGAMGKELVGLEQLLICHTMAFLLYGQDVVLSLPLLSLKNFRYSFGISMQSQDRTLKDSQSYILQSNTESFMYNFNWNFLLYILPLILSLLALAYRLRYKHLPTRRGVGQQYYDILTGQALLYFTLFNLTPLVLFAYLFYTQSSNPKQYYSNLAIFCSLMLSLCGVYNYFCRPEIVGMFRGAFKNQSDTREAKLGACAQKAKGCISRRPCQQSCPNFYTKIASNFYLIVLVYLITQLAVVLMGLSLKFMIILAFQGLILLIVLVIKPFFNTLQKVRSIFTWLLMILATFLNLTNTQSNSMCLAFIFGLCAHSLLAIVILIFTIIDQVKRKCNDRSDVVKKMFVEVKRQTTRDDTADDLIVQNRGLKQLINKYHQLSRDRQQQPSTLVKTDIKNCAQSRAQSIAQSNAQQQEQDEQQLQKNDIILEQHDHIRYQDGLSFFNRYEKCIDNELINSQYDWI